MQKLNAGFHICQGSESLNPMLLKGPLSIKTQFPNNHSVMCVDLWACLWRAHLVTAIILLGVLSNSVATKNPSLASQQSISLSPSHILNKKQLFFLLLSDLARTHAGWCQRACSTTWGTACAAELVPGQRVSHGGRNHRTAVGTPCFTAASPLTAFNGQKKKGMNLTHR